MPTKSTWRSLGLIGLLGGFGGAITAFLCFANLVNPSGSELGFSSLLIPAGACHGALLAVLAVGFSHLLSRRSLPLMLTGIPIAGWIAGWLSWIPLKFYLFYDYSYGISAKFLWHPIGAVRADPAAFVKTFFEAFFWPFRFGIDAFSMPFFLGLVVVVWLGFVALIERRVVPCVPWPVVGVISGIMGSAWWHIFWSSWWFSMLHGTIWGALVGFGVWKSQPWRAVEV